jgi:hypothetical protein
MGQLILKISSLSKNRVLESITFAAKGYSGSEFIAS